MLLAWKQLSITRYELRGIGIELKIFFEA
jgi:hypothetical protein